MICSVAALPALAEKESDGDVRMNPHVRPAFQAVTLMLDPSQDDYSGGVVIQLDISEPTDNILLHAQDMTVQRVVLRNADGDIKATHEQTDPLLTIHPSYELQPGTYTLEIDFDSPFNTKAVGLYRMEHEGAGYAFKIGRASCRERV